MIEYKATTKPGTLITMHMVVIDGEILTTTRKKEVLLFAKPRINNKYDWEQFKEAVRLESSIQIKI